MSDQLEEPNVEEETTEEAATEEAASQEEQAEQPKEEPKDQRMVPLAALNEARTQIRELKGKVDQFEGIKEQLDEWRQQRQQQEQSQEFDRDPLGALRKDIQSLKEYQEQDRSTREEREAQLRNEQEFQQRVGAMVNDFKKSAPDYDNALSHLLDARSQELQVWGIPQDQIPQVLEQEAVSIAQQALQTGQNPGEVVYNLAKLRGYTASQQEESQENDRVAQLEKGQKASQSLSGTRGSAGDPSLTDIEKMSDEEFDAWWDKNMK